jgi:hypothetical protein
MAVTPLGGAIRLGLPASGTISRTVTSFSGCGVQAAGRWLRAMETRLMFFRHIEQIGGQRQAQEK